MQSWRLDGTDGPKLYAPQFRWCRLCGLRGERDQKFAYEACVRKVPLEERFEFIAEAGGGGPPLRTTAAHRDPCARVLSDRLAFLLLGPPVPDDCKGGRVACS